MKITINEQKVEKKEYRLRDYEVGTIIKFNDGVTGLIINEDKVQDSSVHSSVQDDKSIILLEYSSGANWFSLCGGYIKVFKQGKFKVLGKIQEIIVG